MRNQLNHRPPMHKAVYAVALATFLTGTPSSAAELATRYGVVKALPTNASTFTISFGKKQLATIEADDVSLLHVTASGRQEHIVIEQYKPGLYCRKSYRLITIKPDKKASISPSFGDCTEIESAIDLKNGVRIQLRALGNPHAKHPMVSEVTWQNGHLSERQRAVSR
ncbi:MAG: hypothetical protein JWR21_4378 [Herminiimonas sp.]|nr:hypothetical protein [Herminiimonas sp.]